MEFKNNFSPTGNFKNMNIQKRNEKTTIEKDRIVPKKASSSAIAIAQSQNLHESKEVPLKTYLKVRQIR